MSEFVARARAAWARLIRKVYEADPLVCPKCTAPMRIIALIDDPHVARRILEHLGLRHAGLQRQVTGHALLRAGGLEFDNMNGVYRQFFPKDPPARTTCGVQMSAGMKVEIECIALAS